MIDFKFHVVSLIAVFMALAVGILLGAGPLGGAIGDTLSSQLQDLRADREQMREELSSVRGDLDGTYEFLEEGGPQFVDGTLDGGRIALLAVPGTNGNDIEAVRDSIVAAGGQVVAEGVLTDSMAETGGAADRAEIASNLGVEVQAGTDAAVPLGDLIADALTIGYDEDIVLDGQGEDQLLVESLMSADPQPVALQDQPDGRADAIVLVTPRTMPIPQIDPEVDEDEDGTPDVDAASDERRSELTLALQTYGAMAAQAPFVVVGAAESEWDLVGLLRAEPNLADGITTVDSVGEVVAAVSTPLAAAPALDGIVDHYGFDDGAEALVPPPVPAPSETRPLAPPTVAPEAPSGGQS
jgi:outer membrane murein-binding lipoprotein Lpp